MPTGSKPALLKRLAVFDTMREDVFSNLRGKSLFIKGILILVDPPILRIIREEVKTDSREINIFRSLKENASAFFVLRTPEIIRPLEKKRFPFFFEVFQNE